MHSDPHYDQQTHLKDAFQLPITRCRVAGRIYGRSTGLPVCLSVCLSVRLSVYLSTERRAAESDGQNDTQDACTLCTARVGSDPRGSKVTATSRLSFLQRPDDVDRCVTDLFVVITGQPTSGAYARRRVVGTTVHRSRRQRLHLLRI